MTTKKRNKSTNVNIKNMIKWFSESEQAEFKGEPIPSISAEEQARRIKLFKIALWHADLQKKVFTELESSRTVEEEKVVEDAWWQAIR